MFQYPATVLAVHDGDTLHLDVDLGQPMHGVPRTLGFSLYVETAPASKGRVLRVHEDFRLYGINAPELANPDGSGLAARDTLLKLLSPSGSFSALTIRTYKVADHEAQEKYGRWLASLWLVGEDPNTVPSINDRMVSAGAAKPYFGVGPKP